MQPTIIGSMLGSPLGSWLNAGLGSKLGSARISSCLGSVYLLFVLKLNVLRPHKLDSESGLCSTHEPWVKFDSTLTQMSRVRVESAVKIQDMSRVRVESRWLSFESELSQLDTAWVKVESLIFRRENVKILQLSVTLQRKNQPTDTFDRIPPSQQLFPKLGKMWWVMSQIWLLSQIWLMAHTYMTWNSDSNELSQSWVRLVNLGLSWVGVESG